MQQAGKASVLVRVLAASFLIFVLAVSSWSAAAGQDGAPPTAGRGGGPGSPTQLSELLIHSPLGSCRADDPSGDRAPRRARVVTWNIRAARSAPLEAIVPELRAMQADVFALQEVDVRTRRSGFVDAPAVLAAALGYHHAFAASIRWDEGDYGLAVLSRWPLIDVRRHRMDATLAAEPRILLEVAVCADGRPLHLFNHHADWRSASREAGLGAVKAIVRGHIGRRMMVLGDFNETASAPGVRGLVDAGLVDLGAGDNVKTAGPGRIDLLLVDAPLARLASAVRVWHTDKSDHHAVLADFDW